MKVYLAGPMRGLPQFNFPAFHKAARFLRALGYEVFNPAEKDCERHGKYFGMDNHLGSEAAAASQHGFSLREALGDDLAWICAEAEAIALLPDWNMSKGARAERATAEALGLKIIHLNAHVMEFVTGEHTIAGIAA
jgi:hypothetical protein